MENCAAATALPTPFQQPKPGLRWTAFALAVVGWLLSFLLLLSVGGQPKPGGLLDAVCGPAQHGEASWDCRSVLRSKWGSWPRENPPHIPVSAYGMAYFAFVGLWYLLIGPPTRGRGLYHAVVAAVVVWGCWESLGFIRIMATQLHQWCALCLGVHAVNAGLLLVTIAAWPWKTPASPRRPHPTGRLALATVTAALLASVVHLAVVLLFVQGADLRRVGTAYQQLVGDPAYVVWHHNRQPHVEITLRPDDVFLGSPNAPNTVVIFSHFQCTACREAHGVLEELARTRPEDVRIVFRHFPQDPACNPDPKYTAGTYPVACEAARAYEAARIVGGPDSANALRQRLYAHQTELEARPLEDWAASLGLDPAAFAEALRSAAAGARIADDIAVGTELGIAETGVPALFLNGRRVIGWKKMPIWDALLQPAAASPPPTSAPRTP